MFDIFRASGWILFRLARIYHWNNFQRQLDFGDLDLIFKVTGVLEQMKVSLKFNLSLDSYQTRINCLGDVCFNFFLKHSLTRLTMFISKMLLKENKSYLVLPCVWTNFIRCIDIRPVTIFRLASIARELIID